MRSSGAERCASGPSASTLFAGYHTISQPILVFASYNALSQLYNGTSQRFNGKVSGILHEVSAVIPHGGRWCAGGSAALAPSAAPPAPAPVRGAHYDRASGACVREVARFPATHGENSGWVGFK